MNQQIKTASERTSGSLPRVQTLFPHKALHLVMGLCMMGLFACAGDSNKGTAPSGGTDSTASAGDTSIKLPSGFSISVVAEGLGKARHIVVAPNGVIFVKLERVKDGKGIIRLQDTNGDG